MVSARPIHLFSSVENSQTYRIKKPLPVFQYLSKLILYYAPVRRSMKKINYSGNDLVVIITQALNKIKENDERIFSGFDIIKDKSSWCKTPDRYLTA
jgi:hypothetical protein